ncbi:MAG: PadR family transcriptional regulator [Mycobacteriaceae bacterium]
MSTSSLTTTSYALLGLLAIRRWSSYELTQQMDRSLGRVWPRATSKLYEEPKKLVAHGLARSSTEQVGRRKRTLYSITEEGRQALATWLQYPGEGPVLEFEQLLKVFFAENGTRADALATLAAAQEWARARCEESWAVGRQYLDGHGPFPERLAELQLTSRFITDFYRLVGEWARWAADIVNIWPDDLRQARHDPAVATETVRRAAVGANRRVTSTAFTGSGRSNDV